VAPARQTRPKKSKSGLIITLITILAVAFLASALVYLWPSFNFFKTSLTEIKIASQINNNTKQPERVTDTFSPDAKTIFLTAKINYGKKDTKVKVVWYWRDHKIAEFTQLAPGTRYLAFEIQRTQTAWPAGDYSAKVFLDGNEVQTVHFSVPVK
jgi:flagellar basal body-associated protein FliL